MTNYKFSQLPKWAAETKQKLNDIERMAVDGVFDEAERFTPVDTGKLKGSIVREEYKDGGGNTIREMTWRDPKAHHVHYGTTKRRAKPFAIIAGRHFPDYVADAVRKLK